MPGSTHKRHIHVHMKVHAQVPVHDCHTCNCPCKQCTCIYMHMYIPVYNYIHVHVHSYRDWSSTQCTISQRHKYQQFSTNSSQTDRLYPMNTRYALDCGFPPVSSYKPTTQATCIYKCCKKHLPSYSKSYNLYRGNYNPNGSQKYLYM